MTVPFVIVGGGISGLAAAWELRQIAPNAPVRLIERDERLGGKIHSERVGETVFEAGADSFLSRKTEGIAFCQALGIEGDLVGRRPEHHRTFVRHRGALYDLPSGLSGMVPTNLDALATTPLLSDEAKQRVREEPNMPPRGEEGDESIAAFITRRFGREVYECIVEPLMAGIYAGDGRELSVRATFPALLDIERRYGSIVRGLSGESQPQPAGAGPPFVSFVDGMGTLISRVLAALDGVDIELGIAVTRIERDGPAYRLTRSDGTTLRAGAAIVATPAPATSELVAPIDGELAHLHANIPYSSCATINLLYAGAATRDGRSLTEAPPEGYGYVVPRIEGGDVLACTFSSNKWPQRTPAGHFLARVYVGRAGRNAALERSDAELLDIARAELRQTLGLKGEPIASRVHRWPRSMPQYIMGHVECVQSIEEKIAGVPGLFLAGAAYRGVGIPDCIRSGRQAAKRAARFLNGKG